jgi:hypothetical protein
MLPLTLLPPHSHNLKLFVAEIGTSSRVSCHTTCKGSNGGVWTLSSPPWMTRQLPFQDARKQSEDSWVRRALTRMLAGIPTMAKPPMEPEVTARQ